MPMLNGVPFENPVWVCPDGTMREEDWPHITQTRYLPPPGFYWVRWRTRSGEFCSWTVAEVSVKWHSQPQRFRVIGEHERETERYDIRDAEWVTMHPPDIVLAERHEFCADGFKRIPLKEEETFFPGEEQFEYCDADPCCELATHRIHLSGKRYPSHYCGSCLHSSTTWSHIKDYL